MLKVIYEDNHLVVVNKPSGLLVQGDKTGDETLLDQVKAYIKEKYKKPGDVFLGVVHRIDRPVSGAVIFGRTSKGLERMNMLFQTREVNKTYWALVKHQPPQTEGELIHWIKKNEKINKVTASNKDTHGAQKAILTYKLAARIADYYMLEVKPETGRPHQIRAQLAKIGCPIVGDLKYGYHEPAKDGGIYLHARAISFEHPIKKEPVRCTAAPPDDQVWGLFK